VQDNSSDRRVFREEAMKVLLKYLEFEENSDMQLLSAFILSNLGGTYAWTGEPYTTAWLVKKAGLTSLCHRNMIRNFNWSDKSLQVSCKEKYIGFYRYQIYQQRKFHGFAGCFHRLMVQQDEQKHH
jgi:hypothetical protein